MSDQAFFQSPDGLEIFESTLPDDEDAPTLFAEGLLVSPVAVLGFADLLARPFGPGFREPEVFAALVTMPEAVILKDSPQGIARGMEKEILNHSCYQKLVRHPDFWFGGVDLELFLRDDLKKKITEPSANF